MARAPGGQAQDRRRQEFCMSNKLTIEQVKKLDQLMGEQPPAKDGIVFIVGDPELAAKIGVPVGVWVRQDRSEYTIFNKGGF